MEQPETENTSIKISVCLQKLCGLSTKLIKL